MRERSSGCIAHDRELKTPVAGVLRFEDDRAMTESEENAWRERRFGRIVLLTRRATLPLHDVLPNERHPRAVPYEGADLARQIEADQGILEPLLVEQHPDLDGKFRIIDGVRRWASCRTLFASCDRGDPRTIPVEITDRPLNDDERLRVWVDIQRQRKEWDATEKEMVAYTLVDIVGRTAAANILGITHREVDRFVAICGLAAKLTNLEPAPRLIWAREIALLSKTLLTPTVLDTVVQRINDGDMTDSRDIRKLRVLLRDPVAKQKFLEGHDIRTVDGACMPRETPPGLANELQQLTEAITRHPWTFKDLSNAPDENLERQVEATKKLLQDLRKVLK